MPGFNPKSPTNIIIAPNATNIGVTPKTSAKIPAKSTGIKERPAIATPKTEYTFPLSLSGVFCCSTVCVGTKIDTIAMPKRNDPTTRTDDRDGCVKNGSGLPGKC